jgi:hypothetical protein
MNGTIDNKFHYTMSLGRRPRNDRKHIWFVTFDISRYGEHTHTIEFEERMSEDGAIKAVEEYLSEIATLEYYNAIKDDLYSEEFEEGKYTRGDYLSDCTFLEQSSVDAGRLTLGCGS